MKVKNLLIKTLSVGVVSVSLVSFAHAATSTPCQGSFQQRCSALTDTNRSSYRYYTTTSTGSYQCVFNGRSWQTGNNTVKCVAP